MKPPRVAAEDVLALLGLLLVGAGLWLIYVPAALIVVGSLPQLKVMTPPFATAATKASLVQLSGVPVPTTVRGLETTSRRASAGTSQPPA